MKSQTLVDFADAVFGREKFWASRVFFEDAVLTEDKGTFDEAAAHPLLQPNPTSYQLYLMQNGETLTHWDSMNATLRGYKLYWHNQTVDWRASCGELDEDEKRRQRHQEPLTKKIQPLRAGTKFISKIRFQNLSAVELGALLMIFDLNGQSSTAAYKIGMGKSLGFGSVRITPTLFVESEDAYTELFDDKGFKNPYEKKSSEKYLDAFKKYVTDKEMSETWQKIMDELKKILDWDNKPAPDKVGRVSSSFRDRDNPFLHRAVLPTIGKIIS